MNKCNLILFFVNVVFSLPTIESQTFPCDGSFYISLNNTGSPTTTYKIEYDGTNVQFDNIVTTNVWANATGYNVKDNYIYAVDRGSNNIIRFLSNGSFVVVGSEPDIGAWLTGAGDCNSEGMYVVKERTNNRLYFYNVTGTFSRETSVQLSWSPSSGNSGIATIDLDDIVFDPMDPNVIYTFQRNNNDNSEPSSTKGALLKIDGNRNSPTFGQVDVIGIVPQNVLRRLGALFFDSLGNLYAYGTAGVGAADRLVLIDKTNADATFISTGPVGPGADGCSCPFSVKLEKEVKSLDFGCDSTKVEYEITFYNQSFEDLSGFTFEDVLPLGGVVTSIDPSLPYGGTLKTGSGIGRDKIVFENGVLSKNSSITFRLGMKIPSLAGIYENQAKIYGLPGVLNSIALSDDPSTTIFDDPAIFQIKSEDLPSSVFNQIKATICSGDSYSVNGNSYFQPGQIIEVIPNGALNGCDSTIILDLDVVDTLLEIKNVDLCFGEVYIHNDLEYDETGLYEIFYENGASTGCDSIFRLNIEIGTEPEFDTNSSPYTCTEIANGEIELNYLEGGTPPFMYSLNGEDFQSGSIFSNLESGEYNITVSDVDLCEYEFLVEVEEQLQSLNLFTSETNYELELGDEIQFDIMADFNVDSVIWSNSDFLSCTDCLNPLILPLNDIQYNLTAFDNSGCWTSINLNISIYKNANLFIPNSFSPNSDGINDRLNVFAGKNITGIIEFRVFDRWGNEVYKLENFSPNDLNNGWDGTFRGKLMSEAVFCYFIKGLCIDGQIIIDKGDITLFR